MMPSSVIRFFRYDDQARELTIHFVSGRRYVYLQVPAATVAEFRAAESKGTFFNARIRDHFAYRELDEIRR
jgi:hypothetical protein